MSSPAQQLNPERLKQERDLYLGLLELHSEVDLESFLHRAVELVVGITAARKGYLELFDPDGPDKSWSHSVGFPDEQLEHVRDLVSRGIIAEVIASGQAVMTPSALLDPRFRDRESVQTSRIDAVLCAPIGSDPPSGVLYLETDSCQDFSRGDVTPVELFARHLAPLVAQLFARQRHAVADPTTELRARLRAHDFVGRSRALASVLREVEVVVPLEVGVLLTGETGTGKTQLARLIHRNSPRADGPFIELNCAALPESLIENELFGALPGAHSTASRRTEGKIAAAEGGTLLLDEVAELTLGAQAKLLQLLQTKQYFALGASRATSANVRVIAATNADLVQAVHERRFREDLYYRLQVIAIRVPSLAERREDLALLANHFCQRAERLHSLAHLELSAAAVRAVESAEWPGNVRQLCHAVEAAAIRAASQRCQRIEVSHLFSDTVGAAKGEQSGTFQDETRRFQEQLLRRVLQAADWNVSASARRLDITRAHTYNLIKSFGLKR
jgi:transcriptional regulator with GAF, ATPase, and Fis domain